MYVCICENSNTNLPKSNLKVPFHEYKQSGVTCNYLEMLPLENCMSPSSPISPITNYHEFDGSKKQELGPFNLEGRSLTRCPQEHTPSKCSRRDSFLASSGFWWLFVVLCLWLHTSSLLLHREHLTRTSWWERTRFSPVCLLKGHLSLDWGPTKIIQYDWILIPFSQLHLKSFFVK